MGRVRCARTAHFKTNFKAVLIYDTAESVTADRFVASERLFIHVPNLHSTDTRVFFTYFPNVLKSELLLCGLGKGRVFVILIISLLAYANQSAKALNTIASRILCVQVSYCLAPAFFLIGILNLASATFIISS